MRNACIYPSMVLVKCPYCDALVINKTELDWNDDKEIRLDWHYDEIIRGMSVKCDECHTLFKLPEVEYNELSKK